MFLMENKKIEWIEYLRAISILGVVMLHVIGGWENDSIGRESFKAMSMPRFILDNVVLSFLIRFALPCFIMITGFLLLDPNKEVKLKKIKKYVLRMVGALVTFGFLFCIIEEYYKIGFNNPLKLILNSVLNLLQGKSWGLMWYVYTMIGLYLITPLLKIFVENSSKTIAKYTLITLFFLTMVIPTINLTFNTNISNFFPIYQPFVFYYLIGYYILKTDIFSDKEVYIFGIIGIIGMIATIIIKNCFSVKLSLDSENVFVAMYAIMIFKLFGTNKIKIKNNKIMNIIIKNMSKYSFGIYLTHAIFLNFINKFLHIFPNILPIGIGEILFWFVTVLLSFISCKVIERIPILKRIIV